MSTLAEIEAAIPGLSPEELSELERAVRAARRHQHKTKDAANALDLSPLELGVVLHPLGPADTCLARCSMTHGFDTSFLVAAEVAGHAEHAPARGRLQQLSEARDEFALAPQVLAEFIHVVTDGKRFT